MTRSLPLAAGVVVLFACATAPRSSVEDSYFADLGSVAPGRMGPAVDSVLVAGYGFEMARREEQYASAFYETVWKERSPFDDERDAGVSDARSRVVIRGQRAAGGAYRTVMEGENQVRTDSVPTWHLAPVTAEFQDWMSRIESDLKEETSP